MPSIANRTPNTSPKRPVNSGHSSPNSNESTVPVTAPTANVTADHLRPAPREQQRVGVVAAQAAVVGDQHDRRERHAQRRQDDVEAERERHLAPRRRRAATRRGARLDGRRSLTRRRLRRTRSSSQSMRGGVGPRSRTCGPRGLEKQSQPQSMNASTRLRTPVISAACTPSQAGTRSRRAARGGARPTSAIAAPRPIIAMMPLSW